MKFVKKRTTRRSFLRTGTAGAFAGLLGPSLLASEFYGSRKAASTRSTGRENYKIFSEGHIGKLGLKNRMVRSAAFMGMSHRAYTEEAIAYYKALAEGGVGLIISGHMGVMKSDPSGVWYGSTRINDDDCISNISQMADVVHKADGSCKVIAQINNPGMQDIIKNPISPSGIYVGAMQNLGKEFHIPTTGEVEEIVSEFVDAGERVGKAGFDGVQLHAAHGYLLSTFLSPYANRRTDKYGGSLEKRVTIVREIVEGIRERNGIDFPVLMKMNADEFIEGGIDIDSFPSLAREVAKTGLDAIEISSNNPIRPDLDDLEKQSYHLGYAEKLDLDIPVILTGGNKSVESLEAIIQEKKVDFFGFARPLIREPNLLNRWLEGTGNDICGCISCNLCFNFLAQGEKAECHDIL
ncbi:MAG: NADH:flavin oxidoreductase [Bacteroidales bacterium]|nr:NADH:flavin oxidoreductase [Bacteroidales bacterium]